MELAYTFDNLPLVIGPYAPVPPAVNFSSLAGINTIRAAGPGVASGPVSSRAANRPEISGVLLLDGPEPWPSQRPNYP